MQNEKEKIALFDFCDTLVDFQTANAYVRYCIKHHATLVVGFRYFFYRVLRRLKLLKYIGDEKIVLLSLLKGCTQDLMYQAAKEYYENMIKPRLVLPVISELEKYQKDKYRIVIVSGGYDIYISLFAKDFGIQQDDVISNKLLFHKKIFTGRFDVDCMGEEKVRKLNSRFDKDKCEVVAYSDSESDMPMLKWADRAFLVKPTHICIPLATIKA